MDAKGLLKVFKTLRGAARWYLRRNRIVRVLIFIVIFVLPIILYAYTKTPSENEIINSMKNMTTLQETHQNLSFPQISFSTITYGRHIYYIGDFRLYGNTLFIINSTTYLYYYDKDTLGVILDLSENSTSLFALTSNVNMTYENNTINYVTILLPADKIPANVPSWVLPIICSYVGNFTNPYDAWVKGTLPSIYSNVCP